MLLAAGDTFRAAAAEQLGDVGRAGRRRARAGQRGRRPVAVIFDGVERAAATDFDLVLADTAGRLHTKTNLMEELRKVRRVAEKGAGRVTETLLVIDATTGQNGLAQAREFGEATEVTGVVLTKLDGSAKGGIVFAIETELGIPIKLVGVGETIGDLVPFEPDEFVDALFRTGRVWPSNELLAPPAELAASAGASALAHLRRRRALPEAEDLGHHAGVDSDVDCGSR